MLQFFKPSSKMIWLNNSPEKESGRKFTITNIKLRSITFSPNKYQ